MKKVVVAVIAAILSLVVVIFAVAFFLPRDYRVTRSVQIDAPVSEVFLLVADLPTQKKWSPWIQADDTMQVSYGAQVYGIGSTYSWTSENSGSGSYEVIAFEEDASIEVALDFGEMGHANADWLFETREGGTFATWGMSGEAENLMGRYFGLFLDGMLGPQYEAGLNNLKELAESGEGAALLAARAEATGAAAEQEEELDEANAADEEAELEEELDDDVIAEAEEAAADLEDE